ncbi:CDP-diacylglycerol--glycerol-3-phosphate 3-phosphatidyltransferase [Candidatus Riesia pediculicola]|nr:CDP-diacylglycerol--glycerol-3-phosphate 3-phosphatidyltransferase [Candidatus Riesia pediculicola]
MLIVFFYMPFSWSEVMSIVTFVIAAITDLFDGLLARYFKKTTKLGTFLDPVADKIIVVSSLILVVDWYHVWWITLPSIAMIIREIIILSLRELAADFGEKKCVSVSRIGKWKTFFQMFSLVGMFLKENGLILILSVMLLYFSVFLTYYSMIQYFRSSWRLLK